MKICHHQYILAKLIFFLLKFFKIQKKKKNLLPKQFFMIKELNIE